MNCVKYYLKICTYVARTAAKLLINSNVSAKCLVIRSRTKSTCFVFSGVASAIVNSDHWEKAMRWQDTATGKNTPMKLLIRSMPGTINFM